jgi:hypothetical protein
VVSSGGYYEQIGNWLGTWASGSVYQVFRTTFGVTDYSRASIAGRWGCDDVCFLYLNGAKFSTLNYNGASASFSLTSGFVCGENVLEVRVFNGGSSSNPTGVVLRFETTVAVVAPPCPSGYFCSSGRPQQCPAGSYCPLSVPCQTSYCTTGAPILCPAGSFCQLSSISPSPCPAGTYSSTGASACTPCPGGVYSSVVGATSCTCPLGWGSPAGSSYCFASFATGLSWRAAADDCAARAPGGTLASIRSASEATLVMGSVAGFNMAGWIGLNDQAAVAAGAPCNTLRACAGWVWQRTGETNAYMMSAAGGALWAAGEPNNSPNPESCVMALHPAWSPGWGLNDGSCSNGLGEVCEVPQTVCPAGFY